MQKKGYLPLRMFAYGFSLFAFARGEQKPKWAGYLRRDLSEPFWQGLRFLSKTGDTIYGEHPNLRALSIVQLQDRLHSPSATVRYVTLWELEERGPEVAAATEMVAKCVLDHDQEVAKKLSVPWERSARRLQFQFCRVDCPLEFLGFGLPLPKLWEKLPLRRSRSFPNCEVS